MPAPPTETSAAVGQILRATFVNGQYLTALNFLLNKPLAILRCTTALSIGSAVWSFVNLDASDKDTEGGHSNVTNNSRYTAVTSGWYRVTMGCCWSNNATGHRGIRPVVNGSTATYGRVYEQAISTGTVGNALNYSTPIYLNSGDYVEAYVFQDCGGPLTLDTTPTEGPARMTVEWIAS